MKSNSPKRIRKELTFLGLSKSPSIETLKTLAEEEFIKEFRQRPTYAVIAPGCLNIAGEVSNFNDGKTLCMAIQLFVVVVGKRRKTSKWCCVKTLSKEIEGPNIYKFYLNTNGLEITKNPSWINYIKGAIKAYKAKRELIPGFNVVISSSIPLKTGLGSSTALTIAIYTFLESITTIYTINNFEKAIACQLAQTLVTKESNFVGESLVSIIGCNKSLMEIDTRTLEAREHKWNPKNIEWLFIQLPLNQEEVSDQEKCLKHCREIAFIANKTSFRDVTIEDLSKLESLFSEVYINMAKHIINENNRVTRIVEFIKEKSWKKIGEILWESYSSSKSNITNYDSVVESIIAILKNMSGTLGAKVISHKFSERVLVLVQREAVEEIIQALKNVSNAEFYILRPESGVKILFADDNVAYENISCSKHAKITLKYHLQSTESCTEYYMK